MKIWELASASRTDLDALNVNPDVPEWSEYIEWLRNVNRLIGAGDRERLDREVPDGLCRAVLRRVTLRYHVADGYVRTAGKDPEVGELSAIDVYDLYGGSFLEDVNEAGLAPMPCR